MDTGIVVVDGELGVREVRGQARLAVAGRPLLCRPSVAAAFVATLAQAGMSVVQDRCLMVERRRAKARG